MTLVPKHPLLQQTLASLVRVYSHKPYKVVVHQCVDDGGLQLEVEIRYFDRTALAGWQCEFRRIKL